MSAKRRPRYFPFPTPAWLSPSTSAIPVNIHPKDKQDVADRLTRIALAKTYGRKIEYSGPMYRFHEG